MCERVHDYKLCLNVLNSEIPNAGSITRLIYSIRTLSIAEMCSCVIHCNLILAICVDTFILAICVDTSSVSTSPFSTPDSKVLSLMLAQDIILILKAIPKFPLLSSAIMPQLPLTRSFIFFIAFSTDSCGKTLSTLLYRLYQESEQLLNGL